LLNQALLRLFSKPETFVTCSGVFCLQRIAVNLLTAIRAMMLFACLMLASQAHANQVPNPKANPADPNKVLRLAFPVPETGFDPVRVNDLYSNTVNAGIFQPLITYDWMAMPTKLVPDAAEAMPDISKD
jgi:ABC-type oligopeptide transport system substrate-binding subunit